MIKVLCIALSALVAFAKPAVGAAGEIRERVNMMKVVTGAMSDRNFAKLDKIEHELLVSQAQTKSGTPLIAEFYRAVFFNMQAQYGCLSCEVHTEETFKKWRAASPNTAAPFLAEPRKMLDFAFGSRGNGVISTVSPEGLANFKKASQDAARYLMAHRQQLSRSPKWYEMAQEAGLALGMSRPSYESLLKEAVSKFPRHYGIYQDAVVCNLPQWHGSTGHLERLARYAVRSTTKTDKTGLYARVYWQASEIFYRDRLFSATDIDWPTMKQSMRDISAQYPSDWNYKYFAKFSCLAKDKVETERYIKLIGDRELLPWRNATERASCGIWGAERDLAVTP